MVGTPTIKKIVTNIAIEKETIEAEIVDILF